MLDPPPGNIEDELEAGVALDFVRPALRRKLLFRQLYEERRLLQEAEDQHEELAQIPLSPLLRRATRSPELRSGSPTSSAPLPYATSLSDTVYHSASRRITAFFQHTPNGGEESQEFDLAERDRVPELREAERRRLLASRDDIYNRILELPTSRCECLLPVARPPSPHRTPTRLLILNHLRRRVERRAEDAEEVMGTLVPSSNTNSNEDGESPTSSRPPVLRAVEVPELTAMRSRRAFGGHPSMLTPTRRENESVFRRSTINQPRPGGFGPRSDVASILPTGRRASRDPRLNRIVNHNSVVGQRFVAPPAYRARLAEQAEGGRGESTSAPLQPVTPPAPSVPPLQRYLYTTKEEETSVLPSPSQVYGKPTAYMRACPDANSIVNVDVETPVEFEELNHMDNG